MNLHIYREGRETDSDAEDISRCNVKTLWGKVGQCEN